MNTFNFDSIPDELEVMARFDASVAKLDDAARKRVLRWIIDKFDSEAAETGPEHPGVRWTANNTNRLKLYNSSLKYLAGENKELENLQLDKLNAIVGHSRTLTDAERALLAAYWRYQKLNELKIDSQAVNDILKQIGYGISNITRAFSLLVDLRFVEETDRVGLTAQARRRFKITRDGIEEAMRILERTSPAS